MLCLRCSPIDHHLPSPAELLKSRTYKDNLPATSKPTLSLSANGDVNTRLQERQALQKKGYDKTARNTLSQLSPGDPVRVLNTGTRICEPGVITAKAPTPRAYTVAMDSGSTLTRNRRHIRPTKEAANNTVAETPATSGPEITGVSDLPTPPRRSVRVSRPPDRWDL